MDSSPPPPSDVHGSPLAARWLVRLCRPSRVMGLAPTLAFLLTLPSVFSGYVQDDHLLRQHSLDSTVYAKRPAWDYFNGLASQAEIDHYRERGLGQVTWWTPSTARSRFFRPLASLLHALEFRCFGDTPWVMHVNRALLYALIVFLAARLLSRLCATPLAWGIAALLFAVDDVHAYSSGWISGANTLLACAFGLWALLMHDHWRREQSKIGFLLAQVAFLLSLLSSEGGLALMGYLVAYALFLESGGWAKRSASLIPSAVLAVGYGVFYASQHMGVTGSFDYLSPTQDLAQTLFIALKGTVTGAVGQILSLPMLTMVLQMSGGALIAVALLAALVAIFWRFLRSSKTVGFFALGMLLSLVPFTIGMMGDRYLLWAGLGAAGLLGELFAVTLPRTRVETITAKTLFATNTVVSLVFFIPTLFWLAAIEGNIRKLDQIVGTQDTIVLNGHLLPNACAAALRCERQGQWPAHFYHLYDGLDSVTVKRTGSNTLDLVPVHGWFASSPFSRATKPQELHFKPGQSFNLELMTATIEEATQDGRPSRVSFAFKTDLSRFTWLQFGLGGPRPIEPPPLGQTLTIELWSSR